MITHLLWALGGWGVRMKKRLQNQCRVLVTGSELVELKRHGHQIPECPGLEVRLQRYEGKGPLVVSLEELEWLIAVLDAVLNDPKGYPCVEYEPWKLQYVPQTDERCMMCRRLYDRLVEECDEATKLRSNQ